MTKANAPRCRCINWTPEKGCLWNKVGGCTPADGSPAHAEVITVKRDPEVKRVVAELCEMEHDGQVLGVAIVVVVPGKPINDIRVLQAIEAGTRCEINLGIDVLKKLLVDATVNDARKR